LLEALASGLPVVAVNATCIPELVHDGQNGILVPSRSTDAIADALATIIHNRSLAKQMGRVGHTIVQEHSVITSLDKHETLYNELIARHEVNSNDAHAPIPFSFNDTGQNIKRQLSKIWFRENEF